ncbi:MAG: metallophosphoesterase [Planctomycetota bacterium]
MPSDAPDIVHTSEIVASAVFLFAAMGTGTLSLYVVGRWARLRGRGSGLLRDSRRARIAAVSVLALGLASAVWAWCVEPRMLLVSTLRVESPKLAGGPGRALRLVFMSDLHVEPGWSMEGKLARRVAGLAPDAILLGGDYLSTEDEGAFGMLEAEARALAGIAPTYAVLGNVDALHEGARDVLRRSGVRVLDGESAELGGGVRVFGAGYLDAAALERGRVGLDSERLNVCLTHAPGIIPEAAEAGFDLYLCGHTHGGQVRLPLWGALVTLAVHGKRFECGRYDVGGMVAYVTRGVGLEGGRLAPRVRFLCAPEIVLIELAREAE